MIIKLMLYKIIIQDQTTFGLSHTKLLSRTKQLSNQSYVESFSEIK